jgi:hypothetical protein
VALFIDRARQADPNVHGAGMALSSLPLLPARRLVSVSSRPEPRRVHLTQVA